MKDYRKKLSEEESSFPSTSTGSGPHPDFAFNKKLSDWLVKTQAHKYEEINLMSHENRLEIAWRDKQNRNWCNPVSFNQSANTFKDQSSNILYRLKREIVQ